LRKLLLAAIAAALSVAGSAGAVINGEPDGTRHPYVVALGMVGPKGQQLGICSGTLVSPTVVVTAAHCIYDAAGVLVWAGPTAYAGPPTSSGTGAVHPDFNPAMNLPNTGDLGVVRLSQPIHLAQYAELSRRNYLHRLAKGKHREAAVDIVGYGATAWPPQGPPGLRMLGRTTVTSIDNGFVRKYGIETRGVVNGTGSGMCHGDSGGPVLEAGTNVILGVHSFGNVSTCLGANYAYRVDTKSAREFLDDYVDLKPGRGDDDRDDE
jgi:hypothetical protein